MCTRKKQKQNKTKQKKKKKRIVGPIAVEKIKNKTINNKKAKIGLKSTHAPQPSCFKISKCYKTMMSNGAKLYRYQYVKHSINYAN